jgi:hypothetical protein
LALLAGVLAVIAAGVLLSFVLSQGIVRPSPTARPMLTRDTRARAVYGTAAAPVVGEVLSASTGHWVNSPTSYAYQWRRCSPSCTGIAGATSSTYTLVAPDAGSTIDAVVTASNSAGSASQTSAPTGGVTNPDLVWNGDLSTGNFKQWAFTQACSGGTGPPAGTTIAQNPMPSGPAYANATKFTVADNSTGANCPGVGAAPKPNALLIGPYIFKPGMNVYIAFSVYLSVGFPSICTPYVSGCFFSFAEIYGPPYNGSGPVSIQASGNHFFLDTRVNTDEWNSPNWTPGTWSDFVLHVNFATDSTGYVQVYYDGQLQTLANGTTTVNEATLLMGVNWNGTTPDHLSEQQYRSVNPAMGTVVVYESGALVGTTLASVTGI